MPLLLLVLRPRHKYHLGMLLLLHLLQFLLLLLRRKNQFGTPLLLLVLLQRHKHQLGALLPCLLLQVQWRPYRQLRRQTIRSTQLLSPLKEMRLVLAPVKPSHSGGRLQAYLLHRSRQHRLSLPG